MQYKDFILLSTVLIWFGFGILLWRWRGNRSMSLSLHAASSRNAFIFFAATQVASAALFFIFMYKWFIPSMKLPVVFTGILVVTMLCLVISALVADKAGRYRLIHRIAAYAFTLLLLVITVFVLLYSELGKGAYITGYIITILMFLIWFLFLFDKPSRNAYLIYQMVYIIIFQVFIITTTYLY